VFGKGKGMEMDRREFSSFGNNNGTKWKWMETLPIHSPPKLYFMFLPNWGTAERMEM